MRIASKEFALLRVAAIFGFLVYDVTTQPMTYETDPFILSQNALKFYEQKYDHEGLPYTKFSMNYLSLNVCNLSRSQKVELCTIVLTNASFDYTMEEGHFADLSCELIQAVIVHSDCVTRPFKEIWAYRCPAPFRYELLPAAHHPYTVHTDVRYFVSSAGHPTSAILYYRHHGPAPFSQPDRVIRNLPMGHFQRLSERDRNRDGHQYSHRYMEVEGSYTPDDYKRIQQKEDRVKRNAAAVERTVNFLAKVRDLRFPYRKFKHTWSWMSICPLKMAQKVELCRQVLQHEQTGFWIGFPLVDHSKLACHRREIHFAYEPLGPVTSAIMECNLLGPASKNSYFLSASRWSEIVFLYVKFNPHKEIFAVGRVKNIDSRRLQVVGGNEYGKGNVSKYSSDPTEDERRYDVSFR